MGELQQECGRTMTTGRLVGGLVLTQLAREDVVAANKAYTEFGGWCETDLAAALQILLQGFEEDDADAAKEGLSKPAIKNLDIEFARMAANDIPLPDSGGLEAAASQYGAQRAKVSATEKEEVKTLNKDKEQTTDHNDTAAQQKELEEDEDEEGLC